MCNQAAVAQQPAAVATVAATHDDVAAPAAYGTDGNPTDDWMDGALDTGGWGAESEEEERQHGWKRRPSSQSGESAEEDGAEGDDDEDALSEEEIKALKQGLKAAKSKLKSLVKGFSDRLEAAQGELDAAQAEALVLDILKGDLRREVDRRVVAHRQVVVAAVEGWWSNYRVTLRTIEGQRDAAKNRLDGFLKELGYGG